MKNIKLFKILFVLLILFISFIFINKVSANSISSINMDIYIDSNGTAHIKETWNCNTTQGTEVYHPYYNLGNSKITNISVKDGSHEYTTLDKWSTDGTLSSKAYKCGINNISNGVELCWAISSYGNHTYEVNYEISNFVSELSDCQMVYWTLIPYELSNTVGNIYIKIHSDFNFPQTIDVWGYGKYGAPCYVYDGYIEFTSDGTLYSSEYMTILAKFPLGSFNAGNKLDANFDYYFNMAEEGSTKYDSSSDSIFSVLFSILFIFPFMTLFILLIIAAKKGAFNYTGLDFGSTGRKVPNDVPYFRDIPCKKDIFRAYWIGHNYMLIKNKTDFLGAVLLKWLKEGKVKIEKRTVGKLIKKEETCVIFGENNEFEKQAETFLHNMLKRASQDGILETNEFKKWCSNHYTEILDWFDFRLTGETESLVEEGKIEKVQKNKWSNKWSYKYVVDSSMMNEAKELKGLKKFLKDFTLIHGREPVEVALFEDYLIFAQILGIAKSVAKDFEKLYPNVIQDYNYTYNDILFIHTFAHVGVSSASTAKSLAESYDGGGRRIFFWRRSEDGSFGGRWRWRRISLI